MEWCQELDRIHGPGNWIGEELSDAGIYIAYYRTSQFVRSFEYNPKTHEGEI